MAAAIATAARVEQTDAATTAEVETAASDGVVNPASSAADAAMRSYKQTGWEGVVLDMAQRTCALFVSQLKTF
jgi:hypothetical protein